jgi:hypothetical protein
MSKTKPTPDANELLRLFHAWYYFDFTLHDATAERPAQKIVDEFRHQGGVLAREAQRPGLDGVKILDATQRMVSRLRKATLDCGGDVEKFRQLVLSRGGGEPLCEPEVHGSNSFWKRRRTRFAHGSSRLGKAGKKPAAARRIRFKTAD